MDEVERRRADKEGGETAPREREARRRERLACDIANSRTALLPPLTCTRTGRTEKPLGMYISDNRSLPLTTNIMYL